MFYKGRKRTLAIMLSGKPITHENHIDTCIDPFLHAGFLSEKREGDNFSAPGSGYALSRLYERLRAARS